MSWPETPVSELCTDAVDCVNRTAPVVDYETPYKMIRTSDVKGGFIYTENLRCVTKETYDRWTRRLVPQKGDVILSREAPIGEVGRITNQTNIFLGQRLFHYRPNPEKLDSNFLAYVLQSHEVQARIRARGFGVTVEHIKVGDALNLPIPTPPIEIQRRIGDVLSSYDTLIENNRRRIALLEEAARLLYQEWFVRLRFPGFETVRVVGGVPEGWEVKKISEVSATVGGGTPSTTVPAYWENGDVVWFVPKDLSNNDSFVLLDSEKKITVQGLKESSAKLLPSETILMTSRASLGYFGLFEGQATTNQGFISIIPNSLHTQMYLLYNLHSRKAEIESKAGGTTFKEINKSTFRNMDIVLPTETLLQQFQDFAYDVFKQVRIIKKQNQKLQQARDLLLPRLMRGELTV
jgi:type I restriction enzyme, S subunit